MSKKNQGKETQRRKGYMNLRKFRNGLYYCFATNFTPAKDIIGSKISGKKRIKKSIKITENMKIVFEIDKVSLDHLSLSCCHDFYSHKEFPTYIEYSKNIKQLVKEEREYISDHGAVNLSHWYIPSYCFSMSRNADITNRPIKDIFDLSHSVKIIDDKWEYTLI